MRFERSWRELLRPSLAGLLNAHRHVKDELSINLLRFKLDFVPQLQACVAHAMGVGLCFPEQFPKFPNKENTTPKSPHATIKVELCPSTSGPHQYHQPPHSLLGLLCVGCAGCVCAFRCLFLAGAVS